MQIHLNRCIVKEDITNIFDYHTAGGKNLILDYISYLPPKDKAEALFIRDAIRNEGIEALEILSTRQLYKKLYEIRFSQHRIMYILQDADNVYFLHICKKEKQKTRAKDLELAKRRARETGLL